MRKYSCVKGVTLRFNKNDSDRVKVICKDRYPWLLFAGKNTTKNYF